MEITWIFLKIFQLYSEKLRMNSLRTTEEYKLWLDLFTKGYLLVNNEKEEKEEEEKRENEKITLTSIFDAHSHVFELFQDLEYLEYTIEDRLEILGYKNYIPLLHKLVNLWPVLNSLFDDISNPELDYIQTSVKLRNFIRDNFSLVDLDNLDWLDQKLDIPIIPCIKMKILWLRDEQKSNAKMRQEEKEVRDIEARIFDSTSPIHKLKSGTVSKRLKRLRYNDNDILLIRLLNTYINKYGIREVKEKLTNDQFNRLRRLDIELGIPAVCKMISI